MEIHRLVQFLLDSPFARGSTPTEPRNQYLQLISYELHLRAQPGPPPGRAGQGRAGQGRPLCRTSLHGNATTIGFPCETARTAAASSEQRAQRSQALHLLPFSRGEYTSNSPMRGGIRKVNTKHTHTDCTCPLHRA